jgi:hypothetical protein
MPAVLFDCLIYKGQYNGSHVGKYSFGNSFGTAYPVVKPYRPHTIKQHVFNVALYFIRPLYPV